MHNLRARDSRNGRDEDLRREDLEFDRFVADYESDDANSAEEVISEMGLALVIMLGVVLAINMVLVAIHIG